VGRAVLVAINSQKPSAGETADRLCAVIERHGTLVGRVDVAEGCELDLARKADVIAVLGGDGTLLAATRCFFAVEAPLLGINTGRVGFLAAFDAESLEENAPALFGDEPLSTRTLRMITARVRGPRGEEETLHALNELVITAGPPFRMITLDISIDGERGPSVSGDGLILSTPTGSTAYNVSAGGPIVAPDVGGLVLTPIAAHSLSFRPIVLPERARIEVEVGAGNDEDGSGTTLVADGQVHRRVRTGDVIELCGGGRAVDFVTDPSVSYWRTLMHKMHWAAPPKGREKPGG